MRFELSLVEDNTFSLDRFQDFTNKSKKNHNIFIILKLFKILLKNVPIMVHNLKVQSSDYKSKRPRFGLYIPVSKMC